MSTTVKVEITPEGKKIIESIKQLHDKAVRVGWFKGQRYKDGTQVAAVAAQNEYGNPNKNIPARPFLTPSIIREEQNWIKLINNQSKKVLDGSVTIDQALDKLGFQVEKDIKKSISLVYTPALKWSTIQARLSRYKDKTKIGRLDKPLVDTAHMINTVTHELTDEKK